jgi:hypothetical protein
MDDSRLPKQVLCAEWKRPSGVPPGSDAMAQICAEFIVVQVWCEC